MDITNQFPIYQNRNETVTLEALLLLVLAGFAGFADFWRFTAAAFAES